MPKITDAKVAKALGWERDHEFPHKLWWAPKDGRKRDAFRELPRFTKSLDLLSKEIKKRGLRFGVGQYGYRYGAQVYKPGEIGVIRRGADEPLALCTALLAYLRGRR